MPLYVVECKECHRSFEVQVKLKDFDEVIKGEQVKCPHCEEGYCSERMVPVFYGFGMKARWS